MSICPTSPPAARKPPRPKRNWKPPAAAFAPKFGDDGLIPAIAVDAADGTVLMQAYMNRDALAATLEQGEGGLLEPLAVGTVAQGGHQRAGANRRRTADRLRPGFDPPAGRAGRGRSLSHGGPKLLLPTGSRRRGGRWNPRPTPPEPGACEDLAPAAAGAGAEEKRVGPLGSGRPAVRPGPRGGDRREAPTPGGDRRRSARRPERALRARRRSAHWSDRPRNRSRPRPTARRRWGRTAASPRSAARPRGPPPANRPPPPCGPESTRSPGPSPRPARRRPVRRRLRR